MTRTSEDIATDLITRFTSDLRDERGFLLLFEECDQNVRRDVRAAWQRRLVEPGQSRGAEYDAGLRKALAHLATRKDL